MPKVQASSEIIAYVRVSTSAQKDSGLGIEAQQQAIVSYAKSVGRKIVKTYEEVESGKNCERPELAKAINHAKRAGALLVVAKLDRLARNVAFLSKLMESKVEFVACDNPNATPLTIHILAAVAEHEARQISQRTKDALAAYKARGGLLGGSDPRCRKLTSAARIRGQARAKASIRAKAIEAYRDLIPLMQQMKSSGNTLQAIADTLNEQSYRTRKGKQWSAAGIYQVLHLHKKYAVEGHLIDAK
jgi:DNA invertase Pin-like site-specific DNA recombinase